MSHLADFGTYGVEGWVNPLIRNCDNRFSENVA